MHNLRGTVPRPALILAEKNLEQAKLEESELVNKPKFRP
jgi:hypothetical protein